MSRYLKDSQRLTVKFVDSNTNELLFEVNNRNIMDIGEMFSDTYVNQITQDYLSGETLPEDITVLVIGQYKLR